MGHMLADSFGLMDIFSHFNPVVFWDLNYFHVHDPQSTFIVADGIAFHSAMCRTQIADIHLCQQLHERY